MHSLASLLFRPRFFFISVLQQMRIIHKVKWTPLELESYRQLAFSNILDGMRELLIAMRDDMHINVAEDNVVSLRFSFYPFGKSRLSFHIPNACAPLTRQSLNGDGSCLGLSPTNSIDGLQCQRRGRISTFPVATS